MFQYTPLPKGTVRLLRLLPHADENSRIECQLITCPLLHSKRAHSYEALSYVWGSEKNQQSIYIDGNQLSVRANLYQALLHLRDGFVERMLWIDALCINQEDDKEKGHQVQSMAKIYAKASRVIVWLGDAADGSDLALGSICRAAQERNTDSAVYDAAHQQLNVMSSGQQPVDSEISRQTIIKLLEREWFQRIWILQEVAAARNVSIKSGHTEIDGYAFCLGLEILNLPLKTRPHLLGLIPPVVQLIKNAVFRPRYQEDETSRQERFSLDIRPLGELVDMYHTHKATVSLDKIYALLGMSNDDPYAAGLEPNYEAQWREVFRKLIQFCLSDQMFVATWDGVEAAVIEAKGCVLGEVSSVGENGGRYDRQHVDVTWKYAPENFVPAGEKSSRLTFLVSVNTVKKGDIVCLLQGASRPTIIRLCDGFSIIIMNTIPDDLRRQSASITTFPTQLLLVWDWDESQRELRGVEYYAKLKSSRGLRECPVTQCQYLYDLGKAARLWHFGMLLDRVERYGEAVRAIVQAVGVYKTTEKARNAGKSHPCHDSWRSVDEEALKILDDLLIDGKSADIEGKYNGNGQTLISWAAENDHQALVWILIDKGTNIDAKDYYGRTPLSYAAKNGREGILRLLIDNGANIDAKDYYGRTPLSWAAENGHESVVQLLIDKGADTKCKGSSRTPLSWAAENGHEEVVRLLIGRGADTEAKDIDGRTPSSWAAANGHEAMVRLLELHATRPA